MSQKPTALRVVVVGGGPAGAAIAMSLAQQAKGSGAGDGGGNACPPVEFQVDLFEAYPPPNQISKTSPKAYLIALSKRGQLGLEVATGITPQQIPGGILSRNLVRHPSNRCMTRDPPALLIPRKHLTQYILDQAAQQAGVQIHYQHRLVDIDVNRKVAFFQQQEDGMEEDETKDEDHTTSTTTLIEVGYDLLIGADGANSQVRSLLVKSKIPNFTVRSEVDTMEYQVAVLPQSPFSFAAPPNNNNKNNKNEFPADASHVWNDSKYNSLCLAFPLDTGGMLFAIVFPQGKLAEIQQDPSLRQNALHHLFQNDLNEDTMKALVQQLDEGTPANGGVCVWPSSLGCPEQGIVLVGDSGHGMWPSLGQGANCALESAGVFCQTVCDIVMEQSSLSSSPSLLAQQVIQEYNQRRYKDAMAAVDLTYGGIGGRLSRGRQSAPWTFKVQIMGMMLIHTLSLGLVPKPALLRVMGGDPTLSYSSAHKFHFYYEPMICLSAALLMVAPLAWKAWRRS